MKLFLVCTLSLVVLTACASSPPPPRSAASDRAVPPPVEGKGPVDHILIERSKPQRPEWIDRVPDDRENMHFLVGLSEHHTSEKEARADAYRHATMEFANFTGVEVSEFSKVAKSLYGLSSGVLDPTIEAREESTTNVRARVSRIKAKEWYFERYRSRAGGVDLGENFKYWVLVTAPQDEPQQVQQWLRNQTEAFAREWERFREAARKQLDEIDLLLAKGEVLPAINRVRTEWTRLPERLERFREMIGFTAAKEAEVQQMQSELEGRLARVRNAIYIDPGRFGSRSLSTAGPAVVPVWVWAQAGGGKARPMENLPLVLRDDRGEIVARAVVGQGGRGDFHLPAPVFGPVTVSLDIESGAGSMPEPLLRHLARVENRLTITSAENTLDGAIRNLIARLFDGPSNEPLIVDKMVVGPVTYGETGQGSEFAPVLKRILSEQLTRVPGLEVIVPRPREVTSVAAAAQTRGISAQQAPSIGAAAVQATIDQADAALETIYHLNGEEMRLSLALKEAGTDRLLRGESAIIDRRSIPSGLSLKPVAAVSAPLPVADGNIRLEVTSHLGDGQTYVAGETISYFVNLGRDAYLLLVYEDAGGNLIQILPNRYSRKGFFRAGSTIQIPSRDDGFDFTIAPPFGVERVRAFASSSPFPILPGAELENGLRLLRGDIGSILETVRRAGSGRPYGEAMTNVTTVSGREGVARFP